MKYREVYHMVKEASIQKEALTGKVKAVNALSKAIRNPKFNIRRFNHGMQQVLQMPDYVRRIKPRSIEERAGRILERALLSADRRAWKTGTNSQFIRALWANLPGRTTGRQLKDIAPSLSNAELKAIERFKRAFKYHDIDRQIALSAEAGATPNMLNFQRRSLLTKNGLPTKLKHIEFPSATTTIEKPSFIQRLKSIFK